MGRGWGSGTHGAAKENHPPKGILVGSCRHPVPPKIKSTSMQAIFKAKTEEADIPGPETRLPCGEMWSQEQAGRGKGSQRHFSGILSLSAFCSLT